MRPQANLFHFVWETWIILTRNRLLVDIFLARRLSKSLAFCEFASVNFEPWHANGNFGKVTLYMCRLGKAYLAVF